MLVDGDSAKKIIEIGFIVMPIGFLFTWVFCVIIVCLTIFASVLLCAVTYIRVIAWVLTADKHVCNYINIQFCRSYLQEYLPRFDIFTPYCKHIQGHTAVLPLHTCIFLCYTLFCMHIRVLEKLQSFLSAASFQVNPTPLVYHCLQYSTKPLHG